MILQAIFRKMSLPADDRMMYALISWVILAPVLRVLEDSDFFNSDIDWLLISPIIHIHLAIWLILTGFVAHKLASKWDGSTEDSDREKKPDSAIDHVGTAIIPSVESVVPAELLNPSRHQDVLDYS